MFTDLPLDNFCTSGISKTKLTKCTVVSFDQDTLNTFKSTIVEITAHYQDQDAIFKKISFAIFIQ